MSEAERAMSALLELMARLRDPQRGCPWDREQTFATIAPYTIEEAYEVADAIQRDDVQGLRGELGDLLFQVVFHARMAQEHGWFDFAAVAQGIHDKLVSRHPHVFAGATVGDAREQTRSWEEHKARERADAALRGASRDGSVLADIPQALPALTRAAKLGKRAARVGFDWTDAAQVRAKITEELAEIEQALIDQAPQAPQAHDSSAVAEELGDLLFTIVNWSRHLKLDPERALREANAKFERRFRRMEALAAARGLELKALSADDWEALWREAKSIQ